MTAHLAILIAIACYTIAMIFVWTNIRQLGSARNKDAIDPNGNISLIFALLGVAAHSTHIFFPELLQAQSSATWSMDLSLSSMAILVSLTVVIIFLLGCLALPISRLGLLVYPLAALSLIFSIFWPPENNDLAGQPLFPLTAFSTHILVAILAYALLSIAAVQAMLYLYQEKQIKNRSAPAMLLVLPPLQTMESLLFRISFMAFVLLSITLLSGILFSQQIFGQSVAFKHHTILALAAWLTLAVLLFRRMRNSIRGTQASKWVIGSFILVQLGYFGTKIIREILNLS